MFKLVLEKAEEPEIKLPTSAGCKIGGHDLATKQQCVKVMFLNKVLSVYRINWRGLTERVGPGYLLDRVDSES